MACHELRCTIPKTSDLGHVTVERSTRDSIGEPDMILLIDDELLDPGRGKMMIFKLLEAIKQELLKSDWPL